MERKHTPGPWIFCGTHVDDSHGMPLVRFQTRDPENMNSADMHLVAAAPDMLSVLLEMSEFWECGSPVRDGSDVVDDAYRAIRKALGVRS